jgi:receptor protein-tyrosine kinase
VSLLENALNKLKGNQAHAPHRMGDSVVPVARTKRLVADGPKHHVSQQDLIRDGLLATLDQAVPVADEFRRIKRPLISNVMDKRLKGSAFQNVIMITSPLPRAGKTFCAVNLAVSIALERDLSVLLVDADVAKPHVTRAFGLEGRPGLIDLLVDETADINPMLVQTDLNDVQVLPAGRSHPQATELLASDRMSRIVRDMAGRYSDRVIVFDSPPLLITSEAQAIASQVGQVVIVVEAGRTSHQELQHTVELLNEEAALSVILNKSRSWHWGRGGDYSGEYGHYGYENA